MLAEYAVDGKSLRGAFGAEAGLFSGGAAFSIRFKISLRPVDLGQHKHREPVYV